MSDEASTHSHQLDMVRVHSRISNKVKTMKIHFWWESNAAQMISFYFIFVHTFPFARRSISIYERFIVTQSKLLSQIFFFFQINAIQPPKSTQRSLWSTIDIKEAEENYEMFTWIQLHLEILWSHALKHVDWNWIQFILRKKEKINVKRREEEKHNKFARRRLRNAGRNSRDSCLSAKKKSKKMKKNIFVSCENRRLTAIKNIKKT